MAGKGEEGYLREGDQRCLRWDTNKGREWTTLRCQEKDSQAEVSANVGTLGSRGSGADIVIPGVSQCLLLGGVPWVLD